MISVELDKLHPAPDNPRQDIGDITELADSIREQGLLQPLVVARREEGDFIVVVGHRRLAALKHLGETHAECQIREFDGTKGRIEAMIVENLHREGLTPLEEARAYRTLTEWGMSQRDVAQRVGRSQSHISKRASLVQLPDFVQKKIEAGEIGIPEATMMVPLRNHPDRIKAALKNVTSWKPLDRSVGEQLADLKRELKLEKLEKELADSGVKILPFPDWNEKVIRMVGDAYRDLHVDAAAHASEPCHAVAIRHNPVEGVPLCTEPSRHLPTGASELKEPHKVAGMSVVHHGPDGDADGDDEDLEYERREARRQAAVEAKEARRTFALDMQERIRSGDLAFTEITLFTLLLSACAFEEYFIDDLMSRDEDVDRVLEAAGSKERVSELDEDVVWDVARAAVTELLETIEGRSWLCIETCTNLFEQRLSHYVSDKSTASPWIDFLESSGYEVTEVERELVAPPAAVSEKVQEEVA